jgi:hypothetical protein
VITQRARMQQRPSSATPASGSRAPVLHVRPRALWLECGPVEKKKRPPPSPIPIPAESHATWLSACRWRAKRPSSSTRQANEVGRVSRRASRIWYWFVQSRASRAGAWSTGLHCLHTLVRQQARCALHSNFQQRQPAPLSPMHGVSELSLAPHRATCLLLSTLRLKSLERSQGWATRRRSAPKQTIFLAHLALLVGPEALSHPVNCAKIAGAGGVDPPPAPPPGAAARHLGWAAPSPKPLRAS